MAKSTEKSPSSTAYLDIEVTQKEKAFFPENFGEKHRLKQSKRSWYWPSFLDKDVDAERIKCEHNVIKCIGKYPLLNLMLDALEKKGCNVNLRRHFSCELCEGNTTGGYDPRKNKIIICQNQRRNKNEKTLSTTISHE